MDNFNKTPFMGDVEKKYRFVGAGVIDPSAAAPKDPYLLLRLHLQKLQKKTLNTLSIKSLSPGPVTSGQQSRGPE